MSTLLRRAVRFEAGTWRSLARWLTRRPDVPVGATPFGYHQLLVAPLAVFTGLSLLELVAVDLLVPWPWTWLRLVVLALGVWGFLVSAGMGAGAVVYPHLVTADGLRVRAGAGFDLHVPWEAVGGVRRGRRPHDAIRAARVDDGVLSVGGAGETTVAVTLTRPLTALLPGGPEPVTAVHLHADDAAGLVAAVRSRLAGRTARST